MSTQCLRVESYAVQPAELARPASLQKHAITSFGMAPRRQQVGAPMMRVGFIGLDRIAQAMASKLIKAGHRLMLFDPARPIPADLEAAGGSVVDSIEDACRWADAVFTMLPNDEVAEAVIFGPGGVVESLPRKAIHIGSSSISVACSDRVVEAHWDAGKRFVSAPVLVRCESRAELQLSIIAGGSEATLIAIEPLLSLIGELTQLSGWPSDANLIQQDVKCSGGKRSQFLSRHLEPGTLQDRSLSGSLAFLDNESGLDTEIKGVVQ